MPTGCRRDTRRLIPRGSSRGWRTTRTDGRARGARGTAIGPVGGSPGGFHPRARNARNARNARSRARARPPRFDPARVRERLRRIARLAQRLLQKPPARLAHPPPDPFDDLAEHRSRRAREGDALARSHQLEKRGSHERVERGVRPGRGVREARRRGDARAQASPGREPGRVGVPRRVAENLEPGVVVEGVLERAPRLEPRGLRALTERLGRRLAEDRGQRVRGAARAGVTGVRKERSSRGANVGARRSVKRSQRREVERMNGRVERANKREIAPVPVALAASSRGRHLVQRRRARLERQRAESRGLAPPNPQIFLSVFAARSRNRHRAARAHRRARRSHAAAGRRLVSSRRARRAWRRGAQRARRGSVGGVVDAPRVTRRRRDHPQRPRRLPVDSPVLVHRPNPHPPSRMLLHDRSARVQQVRRVRDDVRRAGLRPVPIHGWAGNRRGNFHVVSGDQRRRPRRVASRARAVARRTQRGRERGRGAADDVPIHYTAAEQVPHADAIKRSIVSSFVTKRQRAPSDVEEQLREPLATPRSTTRVTRDARDEHLASTAFDVDQSERAGRVDGEHESVFSARMNPRARMETMGKFIPARGSRRDAAESDGGGDDLRHRERVMPQRRAKLGPASGRLVEGPDADDAVVSARDQQTGRLRRSRDGAGVRALDREGGGRRRVTATAAREGADHEVSVVAAGDDARRRERAAADETRRRRRPRPLLPGRR